MSRAKETRDQVMFRQSRDYCWINERIKNGSDDSVYRPPTPNRLPQFKQQQNKKGILDGVPDIVQHNGVNAQVNSKFHEVNGLGMVTLDAVHFRFPGYTSRLPREIYSWNAKYLARKCDLISTFFSANHFEFCCSVKNFLSLSFSVRWTVPVGTA